VLVNHTYALSSRASSNFDHNNVFFLAIVINTRGLSALMFRPAVSTYLEM
jgi:hypothetical protein